MDWSFVPNSGAWEGSPYLFGGIVDALETSDVCTLDRLPSENDGAVVCASSGVMSSGLGGTSGSPAAARAILCRRCCSLSGTCELIDCTGGIRCGIIGTGGGIVVDVV